MKRQVLKSFWLVGVIFLFFFSLFAEASSVSVNEYSSLPVLSLNSSYEKINSGSWDHEHLLWQSLLLMDFDDQDDICFVVPGCSYVVKIIYSVHIAPWSDFNRFLPVICMPPRLQVFV